MGAIICSTGAGSWEGAGAGVVGAGVLSPPGTGVAWASVGRSTGGAEEGWDGCPPGALKEESVDGVSDGRLTPGPVWPPGWGDPLPFMPPGIPSPAPSGAMEGLALGSMMLSPADASDGSVGARVPDVFLRTTGAWPL